MGRKVSIYGVGKVPVYGVMRIKVPVYGGARCLSMGRKVSMYGAAGARLWGHASDLLFVCLFFFLTDK